MLLLLHFSSRHSAELRSDFFCRWGFCSSVCFKCSWCKEITFKNSVKKSHSSSQILILPDFKSGIILCTIKHELSATITASNASSLLHADKEYILLSDSHSPVTKKRLSHNVRFRICTKFITFLSNYCKESGTLDWCSIWNWIADVVPGLLEYPLLFSANWLVFLPDLTESPLCIARKLLQGAITAVKGLLNPRFDGLRIRQEDSEGGWREENCTSLRKQRAFPSLCQDEKGRRRKNRNTY